MDRAIAALGDASYLGPWLASVRAEVASIMAADGGAWWPMPAESRREVEALINAAHERAAVLITQAEQKASDIRNAGQRDSDNSRRYAALALRGALDTLEGRKP